ncbi:hypothetical protein BM477_05300 [Boudabousia marimammalium]|uniref:Mechanosensitive ion channel MscS domain-containing protein n=2 Tax=Boudabousia marimammalium TaxID=156892 RepID=A0A1Q5PM75_9ACTO|nr:hypothetical protein BM477_05300 [Boudabousia marimammalium]
MTYIISAAIGVALGLAIAVVFVVILKVSLRRTAPGRTLAARVRLPLIVTLALLGSAIGLEMAANGVDEGAVVYWFVPIQHGLWIAIILGITWILTQVVHIIEDVAEYRYGDSEAGRARRVTTQMQVLRRVLQAIIVVIGIVVALLTFPAMRTAMTALLSSAGVVSLVAGIAAQNVLGNMFAGLQIAFTDSIRVGDILDYEGQYGTVEEITLTYMVLRLWDEKRLIVPSKKLTEESIQNWTRRHTQVLGVVELPMDWSAPVSAARKEMHRLLRQTDLWDGQTASIQVTDSEPDYMTVRLCVSAADPSKLWDLRCYLREHMVRWAVGQTPSALARHRIEEQTRNHNAALLGEEYGELVRAYTSPNLPSVKVAGPEDETILLTPEQARAEIQRIQAEAGVARGGVRKQAEEAAEQNRQGIFDRILGIVMPDEDENSGGAASDAVDPDATVVLSADEILALAAASTAVPADSATASGSSGAAGSAGSAQSSGASVSDSTVTSTSLPDATSVDEDPASSRLYSGSPQAEERAQAFQGPGEEVFKEREKEAERQAATARDTAAASEADESTATGEFAETPSAPAGVTEGAPSANGVNSVTASDAGVNSDTTSTDKHPEETVEGLPLDDTFYDDDGELDMTHGRGE